MSRVRTDLLWVAVARYGSRAIGLVATIILADLLGPEDFGLMAGAMIVIGILDLLYDFGISKEIVYRRDHVEEACHTAFLMNVVLAIVLFLVIVVLAPLAERWLKLNGLAGVLIVTGVALILSSVGKVPAAILQKELRFKALILPRVVPAILATVVAVALASKGAGAYSLAIREVVGSGVESLLLVKLSGYRPKLIYRQALGKEILHYSAPLLGAFALETVTRQLLPLFTARFFGPITLGAYSFAQRLATIPSTELAAILNRVLFPAFAARRHTTHDMQDLLVRATKLLLLVGLPISLAIAMLSPPLLRLAYGSKWDAAIPFFQVLPLYALFASVVGPADEACKAIGKTHCQLEYNVLVLFVLLAAVLPASSILGAVGIAWAATAAAAAGFCWLAFRAVGYLGIPLGSLARSFRGLILSTLVTVAAVVFLLQSTFLSQEPFQLFPFQATATVALFSLTLFLLEYPFIVSLVAPNGIAAAESTRSRSGIAQISESLKGPLRPLYWGIKRTVWSTRVQAYARLGQYPRMRSRQAGGVRLLTYHGVCRAAHQAWPWIPPYFVTEETLDRHLAWLRPAGAIVSLPEAVEVLTRKRTVRHLLYVITLDDGYYNNLSLGLPILSSHRVPATVFLSTALIDAGGAVPKAARRLLLAKLLEEKPGLRSCVTILASDDTLHKPLYEFDACVSPAWEWASQQIDPTMLDSIRFMTSDEVSQMHRNGIELGAHTVNHAILSNLDSSARRDEIAESVGRVRDWSGTEAVPFAYPNGRLVDFSDYDTHILQMLNVPVAVTTVPGLNEAGERLDLYRLFRLAISRRVKRSDFEAMVSGLYDKGRRWQAP